MPLGNIPWKNRLGISNSRAPDASDFANKVLQLPTSIQIYQQQLVHSRAWAQGPAVAAAEWCYGGAQDFEPNQNTALREISAHDSVFARRNLSQYTSPGNFEWYKRHRDNNSLISNYQIYYVLNEPEIVSRKSNLGASLRCPANTIDQCWDPRDWNVDPDFQCIPVYWEPSTSGYIYCDDAGADDYKRICAEALAYQFLKLWHENHDLLKGHIILPPSAADTRLGISNTYWNTFYKKALSEGIGYSGCPTQTAITPTNMQALHIHHYTGNPLVTFYDPIKTTAYDANIIREAADWLKTNYSPSTNILPMHIVLSEFGLDFNMPEEDQRRYAGYFPNMLDGLSWWNSLLAWLTRIAPSECKLVEVGSELDPAGYTLYAAIHNPSVIPYVKIGNSNAQRNQYYFDSSTYTKQVFSNMQSINTQRPDKPTSNTTYRGVFSTYPAISWKPHYDQNFVSFRSTPFGKCYAVWAQVGADGVDDLNFGLNKGWVTSQIPGTMGGSGNNIPLTANITLPATYNGWSTIYLPVIKGWGTISANNVQFYISVHVGGPEGPELEIGKMGMSDFADAQNVDIDPLPNNTALSPQRVYPAMIYPVVCFSPGIVRTITITIERVQNFGTTGSTVYLGRPIVLEGACSWLIEQ